MATRQILDGAALVQKRPDGFWDRYDSGVWEPATQTVFRRLLADGGTHIDIGAWIGPTVLLAATIADVVIAFEPDPVARDELQKNLNLNPRLAVKVRLHPAAVWDREGMMSLHSRFSFGDSESSLAHDRGPESTPVQTVDARTLADDVSSAALVKMDIEGGEYVVVPLLAPALVRGGTPLLLGLHGYPLRERFTTWPTPAGRVARHLVGFKQRARLLLALRQHKYRYLADDVWECDPSVADLRSPQLHSVGGWELLRVLGSLREIDLLLAARPVDLSP